MPGDEPVPVAAVAAMLAAFVNAVSEWQDGSEGKRHCFRVGSRDPADLSLTFGGRFAQIDKVTVWRPNGTCEQMSVEDGVDEFLRYYDQPRG
jgi:hypothetical protein